MLKGIQDEKIDKIYIGSFSNLCLEPTQEYIASPSTQKVRSDLSGLHRRFASKIYLLIIPKAPPKDKGYCHNEIKVLDLRHHF